MRGNGVQVGRRPRPRERDLKVKFDEAVSASCRNQVSTARRKLHFVAQTK